MVLAIDIGNTNVVIGGFQENQILFVERVSTNQNATSLELAISIKTILEIYQIQTTEIEGCIISSVVPQVTRSLSEAVKMLTGVEPMVVGPGIRSDLTVRLDDPATLASDLLVLALSLSYLDLKRIAVSLLTVVLSGQLIGFVQNARVPQAEG